MIIKVEGPQGSTLTLHLKPEAGQPVPAPMPLSPDPDNPAFYLTADVSIQDGLYSWKATHADGFVASYGYVEADASAALVRGGDWDIEKTNTVTIQPPAGSDIDEVGPKRVRTKELDVEQHDPLTIERARRLREPAQQPQLHRITWTRVSPKNF